MTALLHRHGVIEQAGDPGDPYTVFEVNYAAVGKDDLSSTGLTGTLQGDTTLDADGANFDGSGDYVTYGTNSALAIGTQSAMWEAFGVKFNNTTSQFAFINKDRATGSLNSTNRAFQFKYNGSGNIQLFCASGGSTLFVVNRSFTPATDGTEYYIAATWDPSAQEVRVYTATGASDASQLGTTATGLTTGSIDEATAENLMVGRIGATTNYANGSIKGARLTIGDLRGTDGSDYTPDPLATS